MTENKLIASVEQIESKMFLIRGQKVMLDTDLAELYGVETKRLNEQVRRNSAQPVRPPQPFVEPRIHFYIQVAPAKAASAAEQF